jgi:hypothetical protein
MADEKLRCDFCGAPISALDLLRGRAVVVFRRRYCPACMSAAIQRGKSSGSSRYNTPNPAMRRTVPGLLPAAAPAPARVPAALAPVPVPAPPPPIAPAARLAPVPVPAVAAAAVAPPELPMSLIAVLPSTKDAAPETPPAPAPAKPQGTRRLRVGEHGCGFYSSEDDRRYQLGPYLRDGLEKNEKVLHFLRAPSPEKILGDFRAVGLNAQPYLKSGQLEVVPIGKLLGTSGVFEPARVTDRILLAADKALEDGYSRLRIAGEMTWALSSQIDIDSLVEYEQKLTALAVRGKCTSLCQYNVYRFDSKSLGEIRKSHPFVFVKGTAAMVIRELEPGSGS